MALLGKDDHSWGWNIVDNVLIHKGNKIATYPQFSYEYKVCLIE